MTLNDKNGENRAAAAAAAVARKKWREAQASASMSRGPLAWIKISDRQPEHRSFVLACFDPSIGYNPPMRVFVFFRASMMDAQILKNFDGALDDGRDFTPDDFTLIDGAFWDIDGHVYAPNDDDFPVYWMPLPEMPWEIAHME